MPHEYRDTIDFQNNYEEFRRALNALMAAFRHEAKHHEGHDHAILETANAILAHLESSYSEAVWLNHKLERRVLNYD